MEIHLPDKELSNLKEMCEAVGISFPITRQFHGLFVEILKMELIFSNVTSLISVSVFSNLTKLIVINAEVDSLKGVETLDNLNELWVAECKLKTIDHLKNSSRLRNLLLYSNQITQIRGLSKCRLLEVLWLSSNKITVIENLDSLVQLRELNLADNEITQIGSGLKYNTRLEILNLSGNKLLFIQDVISLDMSRLKNLSLADPLYVPNPVCNLCNYVMCILFHFKSLERLDGHIINENDLKREIETIRVKKLYYTMQLDLIKHGRWETSHKLQVFHNEIQQRLSTKLKNIIYTKKELERVMLIYNMLTERNASTNKEINSPTARFIKDLDREKFARKQEILKNMLKMYTNQKSSYLLLYKKAEADVEEELNIQKTLLNLELKSLGTIKFRAGKPLDLWYQACQDLILARFCVNHYNSIGINGIKVKKITKVINEALELNFNKRTTLSQNNDNLCDLFTDKKIGYFFLLLKNCDQVNKILQVIENGCRCLENSDTCRRFDNNEQKLVGLTNSLHHLDADRIIATNKVQEKLEELSFHKGSILLMKTYKGISFEFPDNKSLCENVTDFDMFYLRLTPSQTSESISDKMCACDIGCFEYYATDPDMVIPAYLIEFEYIYQSNAVSPFVVMLRDGKQPIVRAEKVGGIEEMETFVPEHLNASHFNWDDIVTKMCTNNLAEMEEINLHGMQIIDFPCLTPMQNLQKLILTFNCLTNLHGICNLSYLKVLNVSYNYLVTLEGLLGVPNLVKLNVSHNQLRKDNEVVNYLIYNTPNLTSLKIENNPWPADSTIHFQLSKELQNLIRLDGKIIQKKALLDAKSDNIFLLDANFLGSRVSNSRRTPLSLELSYEESLMSKLKPYKINSHDNSWIKKITTVDLSHLSLNSIIGVNRLENLKWANFNYNNLKNLKDVDKCSQLEELYVEQNQISTLEGISNLKNLIILNVNSNLIQSLDECHLDKCENLQTLMINYNQIISLEGLQNCSALLELYLISNKIESIFSFAVIKHLEQLRVLMLVGNPVTNLYPDYRHTILFNSPTLLGLDGKCVEETDIQIAKEILGGRLTIDYIKDHIKNKSLSAIVYLDLSNCSLQSVNLADGSELPNLKSINLEKNCLNSFSGLVRLNEVRVICLNFNHIEGLFPQLSKQTYSFDAAQNNKSCGDTANEESHVLKNLEVLHLAYNEISHIETLQLQKLPSLKSLFLQGNKIKTMSGLEGLWYLEHLVLDRNQITTIGVGDLEALCWLQELHLQENLIKDLPVFYGPSGLQKLFLGSNRIKDVDELFKLSKLPSLEEVSFVGNSVTRRALHRSILIHFVSTLQVIDGLSVTVDERIKAAKYFIEVAKKESGEDYSITDNDTE